MKNVLDETLALYPNFTEVVLTHPDYAKFRQEYEIGLLPPKLRRIVDFLQDKRGKYTGTEIAKALRMQKGNLVSIQLKEVMRRTTCVLVLEKAGERGGLYSFNHISKNTDGSH